MHHMLCDEGFGSVVVVDNLYSGHLWALHPKAHFVHGDVGDQRLMRQVIQDHKVDSILHFAAHIEVEESMRHPLKYYTNNTFKTQALAEVAIQEGVKRFVFSSTAAVYGEPEVQPISESAPVSPINPYGRSKWMSEMILQDLARVKPDFHLVVLRYFNVAGAHPSGRIGQATPRATHLIKVACEVATGQRTKMKVFGTDYPTSDGTCVRDYIHVMDLAKIHLLALQQVGSSEVPSGSVFNCGYGRGASVFEVLRSLEAVSQKKIPFETTERRPGDPAQLYAESKKAKKSLGWTPQFEGLDGICKSAYDFEAHLQDRRSSGGLR